LVTNASSTEEKNDISNLGGSIKVNWYINSYLDFTSISAYEAGDVLRVQDIGGRDSPQYFESHQRDEIDQFTQELRLSYDGDDLYGLVGFFYFNEEIQHSRKSHFQSNDIIDKVGSFSTVPAPFQPFALPDQNRTRMSATQNTQSWAVFGQLEYELTDELKLTTGLRYPYEEI
jgi:iron complex outermembrane receptor protein